MTGLASDRLVMTSEPFRVERTPPALDALRAPAESVGVSVSTVDPTREQFDSLRAMFAHLNTELFAGSLPSVLLNLSDAGARTVAYFWPNRWRKDSEGRDVTAPELTHEISLNPRHLAYGSALLTAQSLLHEMCHLWQHLHGKPGRTGYHNIEWSQKMLAVGLQPINAKTGQPAMSAHSMDDRVIPGGPFEASFQRLPPTALLPWHCTGARAQAPAPPPATVEGEDADDAGTGAVPPAAPSGSRNKTKYSCAACGVNVWGRPGLRMACIAEGHDPAPFVPVG